MKKKFQSALFSPLGRWTGNDFLFKGGLTANQEVGKGHAAKDQTTEYHTLTDTRTTRDQDVEKCIRHHFYLVWKGKANVSAKILGKEVYWKTLIHV